MIEIVDYNDKYAEDLSRLIIRNLLEVNINDYDADILKEHEKEFSVDNLKAKLKRREKVFVALSDSKVVGTAGIEKSWKNDDGEYWILTVFVNPDYHKKGIGSRLIKAIEEYAINTIKAKILIIPASKTACEFYEKMGYVYKDGIKKLNENNVYLMQKKLINVFL